MDPVTARIEPETLDALQTARFPVPLREFRLLPDCGTCRGYFDVPATPFNNARLRQHIVVDHSDLVIV